MDGVQAPNDGPAQVDQMDAFIQSQNQQIAFLQQSLSNMEEQLKLITEQLTAMREENQMLRKESEKVAFEARKKKNQKGQQVAVAEVHTSNRYASLDEEGISSGQDSHPPAKMQKNSQEQRVKTNDLSVAQPKMKRKGSQKEQESEMETESEEESSIDTYATSSESEEDELPEPEKTKKDEAKRDKLKESPRIYVENMPTPKFKKYMNEKKISVNTKILPNGKQVIDCEYKDRGTVLKWLARYSSGGSTTTSAVDRPATAVVKGIHRSYPKDEVREELEADVEFKLKDVRKFQGDGPLKEGEKALHWWLISTDTKEQMLQLRTCKQFQGSPIFFEAYKPRGVLRCYKCQRFNHMATNCLFKPQCGRCPGQHETRECTKPWIGKGSSGYENQWCCNCGKKDHPATSIECPIFLKEKKDKEDNKEKMKMKINKNTNDPSPRTPTAADFLVTGNNANNASP